MGNALELAKRFAIHSHMVMFVLGLIGCALGMGTPFKAVLLYLSIGLILIVISIITIVRVNTAKDLLSAGSVTIQGTWVNMSCGLAWVLIPHAPYFETPVISWTAAIILGIIMELFGVYVLLQIKAKTGAMLSA
jgi:hypothetical protein